MKPASNLLNLTPPLISSISLIFDESRFQAHFAEMSCFTEFFIFLLCTNQFADWRVCVDFWGWWANPSFIYSLFRVLLWPPYRTSGLRASYRFDAGSIPPSFCIGNSWIGASRIICFSSLRILAALCKVGYIWEHHFWRCCISLSIC